MAQGILTVTVLCMFGLGFYIADKADRLMEIIQKTTQDQSEEKQDPPKILLLHTLSDEELLKEVHECKSQYKEAKIILLDGQAVDTKKIFDHNTVA